MISALGAPLLGSVAFLAPWALAALILLPAIWWLLRVTPPGPKRIPFPPLTLMRDLIRREETAARTPWWLLLLRLIITALVIIGLAGPVLNPEGDSGGDGPVVLVVDDGWAAGRDWNARQREIERITAAADRHQRPVILIPTAPPVDGGGVRAVGPGTGAETARAARALTPAPWPTDHAATLEVIRGLTIDGPARAVWLSDGLADADTPELIRALRRLGSLSLVTPEAGGRVHLLAPGALGAEEKQGSGLSVHLSRAAEGPGAALEETLTIRAVAEDGRTLARETVVLAPGETSRDVAFDLPTELRNAVTAARIEGETTAAAVALFDERWRRHPVGLVSGRADGAEQPLLSDLHYLHQALDPFTEVRDGPILDLLAQPLALLVLSDVGSLGAEEVRRLTDWVDKGGLLVRFAGPRMSSAADQLIPVRLRAGDRSLGGAMSWSKPATLRPFEADSPFAGLDIPKDVLINRQVLAEPTLDLADRTWARLADGTPLVTTTKLGSGRIVLVHTTASPEWSNLPLSGLFVEMLRRLVASSQGVAGADENAAAALEPMRTLNGLGLLGRPPATAMPLPPSKPDAPPPTVSPRHPPGLYGAHERRRALNLATTVAPLRAMAEVPVGVDRRGYGAAGEFPLRPWLLTAALALLIGDMLATLWLRGGFRRRRAISGIGAAALLLCLSIPIAPAVHEARAAERSPAAEARDATADTVLAWVRGGDRAVDATAEAGLRGLMRVLNQRTAVETVGVTGVDLENDELAFYPLLYWPITGSERELSAPARARVNEFMRHGGVIWFDTRDTAAGSGGRRADALKRVLQGVTVPALTPIPPDHVLTKSFYLMREFPGRDVGAPVWVAAGAEASNDGVSPVVIGGNDWAAAWATDGDGMALHPVVPGGERQRELSYRFGVNVMIYALTGNYKADQVHVPAILERLGQ